MAPSIVVKGATLFYENHLLFENLTLNLMAGKWTCLLGPSGVGKTSLLRLIAGLTTGATSDTIFADDGIPLTNRVSYLSNQDALLPWLTIVDNILLGRRLRGEPIDGQAHETVRQLLMKVDLATCGQLRPKQISSGMKQRALLARVLFEDRPIVLLDEPFAALDVITRATIQELAATLLRDKTVLLVTHDPLEALRLGHHVYIMAGRPVHIAAEFELLDETPRVVTDAKIVAMQAELLEKLSHAKEMTLC